MSLQSKCGVLTTGHPGNSPIFFFNLFFSKCILDLTRLSTHSLYFQKYLLACDACVILPLSPCFSCMVIIRSRHNL